MTASGKRLVLHCADPPDPGPAPAAKRDFADTTAWIFDLDNTLYPARCNLFAEVDKRMGKFIADYLGVPFEQARHLQKSYYRQFGTTLSGLMKVHKLDPQPFLDYVHDIDLSSVPEAPELATAIDALPGRKLIFTNGSRRHAERVAEKLGMREEGIAERFLQIQGEYEDHIRYAMTVEEYRKREPELHAKFLVS